MQDSFILQMLIADYCCSIALARGNIMMRRDSYTDSALRRILRCALFGIPALPS